MKYLSEYKLKSSDNSLFTYKNISIDDLEKLITEQLANLKYKHKGKGVFEKGNKTKQILFGAFHKYNKINILVDTSNSDEIKISVNSLSSDIFGGLIGIQQIRKEWDKLNMLFVSI